MADLAAKVQKLQRDADRAKVMCLLLCVTFAFLMLCQHYTFHFQRGVPAEQEAELRSIINELTKMQSSLTSQIFEQKVAFEVQNAAMKAALEQLASTQCINADSKQTKPTANPMYSKTIPVAENCQIGSRSNDFLPESDYRSQCVNDVLCATAELARRMESRQRKETFQCTFDLPVLIKSHRQQHLQDVNGELLFGQLDGSLDGWVIRDAGDGKVFLASHRNEYLADRDGVPTLSKNSKDWEMWQIEPGPDGQVFIRSHRRQNLQDRNGVARLSSKNRRWELWRIVHSDGSAACSHSSNLRTSLSSIPDLIPAFPTHEQTSAFGQNTPREDHAAIRAGIHWAMNSTCVEQHFPNALSGMSCSEICAAVGHTCSPSMMKSIRSKEVIEDVVRSMGYSCEAFHDHLDVHGNWDGPWVFTSSESRAGTCGYTSNADWIATCEDRPACSFSRICPCSITPRVVRLQAQNK